MPIFTKGQAVTQVVAAPISGVVEKFAFDEETGDITAMISYQDADGETQYRYFKVTEITAA